MFEVLLKVGYGDADVGYLMVNAIKSKLLEQLYDLVCGTLAYYDVSTNVEDDVPQTGFAKQAAKVRAPILPFAVQRRNKNRVGVDFQRSLAEFFRTHTGAQVEDLESGLLQGQLHNSVADDVNVVPDDADDDPALRNAAHLHPSDLNRTRLDTLRLRAEALERRLFDRLAVQLSRIARDRETLKVD